MEILIITVIVWCFILTLVVMNMDRKINILISDLRKDLNKVSKKQSRKDMFGV